MGIQAKNIITGISSSQTQEEKSPIQEVTSFKTLRPPVKEQVKVKKTERLVERATEPEPLITYKDSSFLNHMTKFDE